MDVDMYNHPSTRQNIEKLQTFGNTLIEPDEGELASGLYGAGRMQEPEKIIEILVTWFKKKKDFKGINALITAGPTYESIDPVRFVGNHSSGQMGYAIAEEFAARGAAVTLVSGPVNLKLINPKIKIIPVVSASEMLEACLQAFPSSRITVMAAAVADFTPVNKEKEKIKKDTGSLSLQLKKTTDILSELGKLKKKNQFLVGFALESKNELVNARKKLKNKNLDLIVLNSLRDKGAGFGYATNKVTLIDKSGEVTPFAMKPKTEVASDIADKIKFLYFNR
jgi:phosphopantothenoylcysteine decarboxylase/phosphopantothenate--cysteine ligase